MGKNCNNQVNEKKLTAQITKNFEMLTNEKILIYGTGKIGQRVLNALNKKNVIGFLDHIRTEGFIKDIPIFIWDDLYKGMADIVIIAAAVSHQEEIYNRIIYNCLFYDLKIYNFQGWDLCKLHYLQFPSFSNVSYYDQNIDELLREIDKHEKISFGLFDTIVTRRVLESLDLFELVEKKAKKKGIVISHFKKKRRTAEFESQGESIYEIYVKLMKMYKLDKKVCDMLLDLELQCEKDIILCREDVVRAFRYALDKGKHVSIISDTYLPSDFLSRTLSELGIVGYDKIYVSCEYGKSKKNGLFDIYMKNNQSCDSFLHIDTVPIETEKDENQIRMDIYLIKSGLELMKSSNLKGLLIYANTGINRFILGGLIADIFNSPFSLYKSNHIVHIKNIRQLAEHFIVPIVICYMKKLYILLNNKSYEGVLFGARDGYLFYKIYQSGILNPGSKDVSGIYFLSSRRLALRAAVNDDKIMEDTDNMFDHNPLSWRSLCPEILLNVEELKEEGISIWKREKEIKNISLKCKWRYLKYFEQNNISTRGEYLFCDLISSGTTHNALDSIFENDLDGLYLYYWDNLNLSRQLSSYSVYNSEEWIRIDNITNILEKIFTSPEPSAIDVDEFGRIVYAEEYRDKSEVDMVEEAHNYIINRIRDIVCYYGDNEEPDKDLAFGLTFLLQKVIFQNSASVMNDLYMVDDLIEKETKITTFYNKDRR